MPHRNKESAEVLRDAVKTFQRTPEIFNIKGSYQEFLEFFRTAQLLDMMPGEIEIKTVYEQDSHIMEAFRMASPNELRPSYPRSCKKHHPITLSLQALFGFLGAKDVLPETGTKFERIIHATRNAEP